MDWLNRLVEEIIKQKPKGEILVQSGISPSGSYHMGYLREILICDAVVLALQSRGRKTRHIHFVDDQDGFRKVPKGLPPEYEKYLGQPLCDMPAPDGSGDSYADFALKPFLASVKKLGVEMEAIRSHERYRSGFFVPAIEKVLENLNEVRNILEEVSGRKLGEEWSPIQVNEEGYLKKRPFVAIDKTAKTIEYLDKDGQRQRTLYDKGQVKLDWRLDWPARWWLLGVDVEPFGRDHATKGGSYDTGKVLMDKVFNSPAPVPIPYEFINRAGETKKMSASEGDSIQMSEVVEVLPAEVIRFFVLRASPAKTLYFDPVGGVMRLIDEFAVLISKENKTSEDEQLIKLCAPRGEPTVSGIPFSHLVYSYQASLKNPKSTIEIIARTEHGDLVKNKEGVVVQELKFIDQWLRNWAPEEVKFELAKSPLLDLGQPEKGFLKMLADRVEAAPVSADGEWFHKAIYELKDESGLEPSQMFKVLYRVLIAKDKGPRAGWFLSILPREWLIKRLRLEA